MKINNYRVNPGEPIMLSHCDPEGEKNILSKKHHGRKEITRLAGKLQELQEILYAGNKQSLLIILQGMDTSGKDGTIKQVFRGVNPQGVRVASFKKPTPEELSHDFLWRIKKQLPKPGEIVICNRSHYEDVLIVRVHKLVEKKVWSKRYGIINEFEKQLTGKGITILKFFLNISCTEQRIRLQARLDDPTKLWKFNPADLEERKYWKQYQTAYEDVFNKTSTVYAPWYLIPANHKWYRDLFVSKTVVKTLKDMNLTYPKPVIKVKKIAVEC
jgi:PPK2 family polyphosphate:nucleotide phosphotransferase